MRKSPFCGRPIKDDSYILREQVGNHALTQPDAISHYLAPLVSEDTQVERRDSHRLDVLGDKLPDENHFNERLRPLALLAQFATTFRYPKDGGRMPKLPEQDAMKGWAAELRSIVNDAAGHFGVDLDGSDQDPATNVDPPRTGGPTP